MLFSVFSVIFLANCPGIGEDMFPDTDRVGETDMSKVTKIEKPVEKELIPHLMTGSEMVDDISFHLAQKIVAGLLKKGLITEAESDLIRSRNIKAFHPFLAELMQK